jgi:hypothetical protein
MSTHVNICFDVPDKGECDKMFDYLTEHPKDVWDYEKRVEQSFHDQGFNTNFLHEARWTDDDILHTTLRRGANDPRAVVDLLLRCRSV